MNIKNENRDNFGVMRMTNSDTQCPIVMPKYDITILYINNNNNNKKEPDDTVRCRAHLRSEAKQNALTHGWNLLPRRSSYCSLLPLLPRKRREDEEKREKTDSSLRLISAKYKKQNSRAKSSSLLRPLGFLFRHSRPHLKLFSIGIAPRSSLLLYSTPIPWFLPLIFRVLIAFFPNPLFLCSR